MDVIKQKYDLTDLQQYKDFMFEQIDIKTGALIAAGFAFDAQTFSLSLAAQSNWSNIKTNKAVFSGAALFPLQISTIDNNIYMLAEVDVDNFYMAGLTAVKTAYTGGSDIKKQVFDAVDIAALDLIEDNR